MRRLVVALLATAALGAQAANLKWAAQNDVLTLDPHSQNHATTNSLLQHTYEGLTRYTKDYKIEPALATSWKQMSDTHWRFVLRKGVKFQDGTPLTADDVVFSFGRIQQKQGTMQIYVTGVKDVVKVDDHTVDFMLNGPVPILLRNIVDFRIMSKAWADKTRSQNVQDYAKKEETYASRNTMGTGPYVIKGWSPDKEITLTQNKGWWGKLDGNVSDVVYNPIKSDATRVSALLSGDVDLVTDLPVQDVERLRKEQKVKVLDGHEVRTIFIGMDQNRDELQYSNVKGKNPFKDVRVRKALNMAVDREAIKRVVMRGLSIPAGIMVAPGVHGHAKEIDAAMKYDPAGAKKLLAEAGYPDGFEFTLDCPNNRYVNDEKICQALVGMWAKAGIRARLNAMPFANFIPKILKFDTSAYMLGWGVATFDGLYTLQSLVRTKTTGADGSFNLGRISDAKLDTTIDAIKIATDTKARDALLREGLLKTRDEHYYIPLHHQLRPWAMKRNVSIVHSADDRPQARFARIEGGS
ncbi:MAG: ABC transporter substrate-binding protein [Betaproteobacteria bacterium]